MMKLYILPDGRAIAASGDRDISFDDAAALATAYKAWRADNSNPSPLLVVPGEVIFVGKPCGYTTRSASSAIVIEAEDMTA